MSEQRIPSWRLRLARIFLPRSARLTAVPPSGTKAAAPPSLDVVGMARARDEYMRTVYGDTPENRVMLYDLYNELDTYPELAAILDSYAEECSQVDFDRQKTIWCEAADEGVAALINDLFYRIEAEEGIYPLLRDLAKLGDFYYQVHGEQGKGVDSVEVVEPGHVERLESRAGTLLGFGYDSERRGRVWTEDDLKSQTGIYKPWDFVHFRLLGTNLTYFGGSGRDIHVDRAIHGQSVLRTSAVPAKQFKCAVDSLMTYRMTNSLDRRNIMVDVGVSATEIESFEKLNRWKNQLKRQAYRNPQTGEYDVLYNPLGLTDDLIWPTWKDSATKIDVTPGQPNIFAAFDTDFVADRLFSSARTKRTWYGYGEEADANRSFGFRSIQFARQAMRLQRAAILGLTRLAQIHLALLGKSASARTFRVCMVPSSPLELLQRLEVLQTVLDVGDRMTAFGTNLVLDMNEWREYVLRSLLSFTDRDIERFCSIPIPAGAMPGAGAELPLPAGAGGLGAAGSPLETGAGAAVLPPAETEPLPGAGAPAPVPPAPPAPPGRRPEVASRQPRVRPGLLDLLESEEGEAGLLRGVLRSVTGGGRQARRVTVEGSDRLPLPGADRPRDPGDRMLQDARRPGRGTLLDD